MNAYHIINSVIATAAILLLRWLGRRGSRSRTVVYAAIVTTYSIPWDYVAITYGSWYYPDGYKRLLAVPINDVVFVFFASLLTVTLIMRFVVRSSSNT